MCDEPGKKLRVRLTPEAFAKGPGGVQRTAVNFMQALRLAGVDVSISSIVEPAPTVTSPSRSGLSPVFMHFSESAFFVRQNLRRARGVAHALYYDPPLTTGRWPVVVTVYDMIHERFGEGSSRLRWAKQLSVRRAALIVTPSKATTRDLVRFLPNIRSEIITIPLGVAPEFFGDPLRPTGGHARPYLLYVGRRSGYKNHALLVRALAGARDLADLRLVLVGGEPLLDNERAGLVDALGARDRISHVASPSDDVLRRLYDDATVLVVTSRCEGFGLPLLEAMARGCPVACAEGGASSEIGDGHATMFSPDSPEACAVAIREAVALPLARRQSARMYARRFDWGTTAQAHVDAYQSLL